MRKFKCRQCGYTTTDPNIEEKGCLECDDCDWEVIEEIDD